MRVQVRLKYSAFAALMGMMILGTAQAQQSAGAPEQKSLTVMATSDVQIGGPWIVAREKGFFAEEGFDRVELKLYSAAPPAFPGFASGELQVMSHGEQPMLTLVAADIPLSVLGIYSDLTGLHGMIASSGIKVAKDLEGKTLGVQKGSALEWYTRSFCKVYGCDITKVKIVNMPAPESIVALANGIIDAYAGWEPFIGRALDAGKGKGLHLLHYNNASRMSGSEGPRKIHSSYAMLYVAAPFLQKNPRTVDALLRILIKSINFTKTNRAEAAKIIAAEFKISENIAASYIDAVKFELTITNAIVENFQVTADILFGEKLVKKRVDFAKTALDTAPLKRVLPNAVTYGR